MNKTKLPILLTVIATAMLGACSSTPVASPTANQPPKVAPANPANPASVAAATPKPTAASKVAPVSIPAHRDPNSAIAKQRSVYFDFDDYTIKKDYGPLVERHGQYLATNPAVLIRIEGNADERGSAEYNLALGQKRAQALLQTLKIYGVKDSQMEAISWGKEKPRARGHTEADWAENRRADIEYPSR